MATKTKSWLLSKTVWVGIIEVVIAILGLLATWLEAGNYTSASITLLVVGILTVVLRKLTTVPIV